MDALVAPQVEPGFSQGDDWRFRTRHFLDELLGALCLSLIGSVLLHLGGVTGRLQWLSLIGVIVWPLLRRARVL
jgi:hypothetical protein